MPFCQWCFSAGAAGEHQKSLQSSAALRLNRSWHGPDEPLISDTFSLCDFYWCVGKKRQIELPPDRSTNCFRKSSKHLSPSPSLSIATLDFSHLSFYFPPPSPALCLSLAACLFSFFLAYSLSTWLCLLRLCVCAYVCLCQCVCENKVSSLVRRRAAALVFLLACAIEGDMRQAPGRPPVTCRCRWGLSGSLAARRLCQLALAVIAGSWMKSALTKCSDWWMAEAGKWMREWMGARGWGGGGASLTQANRDRQRGMTCWSSQPRKAPLQFTRC